MVQAARAACGAHGGSIRRTAPHQRHWGGGPARPPPPVRIWRRGPACRAAPGRPTWNWERQSPLPRRHPTSKSERWRCGGSRLTSCQSAACTPGCGCTAAPAAGQEGKEESGREGREHGWSHCINPKGRRTCMSSWWLTGSLIQAATRSSSRLTTSSWCRLQGRGRGGQGGCTHMPGFHVGRKHQIVLAVEQMRRRQRSGRPGLTTLCALHWCCTALRPMPGCRWRAHHPPRRTSGMFRSWFCSCRPRSPPQSPPPCCASAAHTNTRAGRAG